MTIENARYAADGATVLATIDDIEMTIPDDPGNRHRQALAEWIAAGGVIEPYVAPVVIPSSITARQGKRQLLLMGLMTPEEAIAGELPAFLAATIAGMDPVAGAEIALSWRESTTWERSDPLFAGGLLAAAAAALGLPATEETVDQFFVDAAGLQPRRSSGVIRR